MILVPLLLRKETCKTQTCDHSHLLWWPTKNKLSGQKYVVT